MISSLDQVTEFPLVWPESKGRAAQRRSSSFVGTTIPKSTVEIEREMKVWRIRRFIVSQEPAYRNRTGDPGVALWWVPKNGGDLRVLACDTYHRRECNLHAIALTLQNLRAIERYGTVNWR